MKIAFLDRDGTINLDYPDKDWKYIQYFFKRETIFHKISLFLV